LKPSMMISLAKFRHLFYHFSKKLDNINIKTKKKIEEKTFLQNIVWNISKT